MMDVIRYVLLAVEVIVAFLLVGVVLLQRSKDSGVGLAFGTGMGESLFGAQAVNVLVKVTIVLAVIFLVNTMILGRIFATSWGSRASSSVMTGQGTTQPVQPPAGNLPVLPPAEQPPTTPVSDMTPAAPASGPAPVTEPGPAPVGTPPPVTDSGNTGK